MRRSVMLGILLVLVVAIVGLTVATERPQQSSSGDATPAAGCPGGGCPFAKASSAKGGECAPAPSRCSTARASCGAGEKAKACCPSDCPLADAEGCASSPCGFERAACACPASGAIVAADEDQAAPPLHQDEPTDVVTQGSQETDADAGVSGDE
jgi:hypothetical protein